MKDAFDWNDIGLILSLARTGNKSATGRALGLDDSTVGRRLAAAERALQARLFTRDANGWRLTDAGRAFAAQAVAAEGLVRNMLLAASGDAAAPTGTVRLSTIDFLLDYWLMAQLPALAEAHPGLVLQLQGSNENLSFLRLEADLALRLSRPEQDAGLLMRKLGSLGFAVYASAAAPPCSPAQWQDRPWITYGAALAHLPEMRWIERHQPRARRALQVDSLSTMLRACRAGAGLALLPCLLGNGADEGLQSCSDGAVVERELWLLRHRDAGGIARFDMVAAWLTQRYAADSARLSGATV